MPGVADIRAQLVDVAVGLEQAGDRRLAPQGCGTRVWLVQRLVGCVFHGNGVGAHFLQFVFPLTSCIGIGWYLELYAGHVDARIRFSRSVVVKSTCLKPGSRTSFRRRG